MLNRFMLPDLKLFRALEFHVVFLFQIVSFYKLVFLNQVFCILAIPESKGLKYEL